MDNDALYWDPYDARFVDDPWPVFNRIREEAPLYYNQTHDFYALSRYARRRTGGDGPGDVLLLPRRHARADQGEHGDAAGHPHHGGSAGPRHPPAAAGPRVLAPADRRARAADPRVLRPLPRPAGRRVPVRPDREARPGDADAGHRHAARHPRGGPGRLPRPGQTRTWSPRTARSTPARAPSSRSRRSASTSTGGSTHPSDDVMTELINARVRGRERRHPHADPRRGPDVRHRAGGRGQRDHRPADRLDGLDPRPAPGAAGRARGRPVADPRRGRGGAAARAAGPVHRPLRRQAGRALRAGRPRGQRDAAAASARPTATRSGTTTRTGSTSAGRRACT